MMVKITKPKNEQPNCGNITKTPKSLKTVKVTENNDLSTKKTSSKEVLPSIESDSVVLESGTKRKIALLPDEMDFVRGKPRKAGPDKMPSGHGDNLFNEEAEEGEASKHKDKKLKEEFQLGKPLEDITYKKLSPGMLVLGVVTEVGEVDVVVSLPNGLTGFIKGTDISSEFNKTIAPDQEESGEEEQEFDLCEMVSVGQYLVCSVLSVVTLNKNKKVNLTTKPEIVNKNIRSQDIAKHMVLQGVVQSVEDHGYLINIGVSGTTAFLNKAEGGVKKCDVLSVVVMSVANNNVIVGLYTNRSKTMSDKVLPAFNCVLPGHLVNVAVKKQAVNGIRASFLGGMQGMLHLVHLTDMYNTKPVQEVYPLKRKLTARVVLVNPDTKVMLLSMLPCHVTLESPRYDFKKGDVIEEVTVVRVTRRGVFLDIDNGVTGFAHVSKLQDKEVEKIGANFKPGTTHKARIMGFRLSDDLVQLSLRPSDIAKPFLSYHDIAPCSVVMATVVSVEEFGLLVKLADNIRGVVPRLHLADVNIKNPALKFTPKQKVKAKVMTVDPVKRRLTLTLKRSIIRNSTADVTCYEDLKKNQQVTGWVAAIKHFGIIMNFTAKTRGLVHTSDISNVPMSLSDITKLYRLGQVLSCRVLHVEPSTQKLHLSLNLLEEMKKSESPAAQWARRGQVLPCTVVSNKPEGLSVILDQSKEEAFLPTAHLSDHPSLLQPKLLHLKPGSKIEKVLVLQKKQKKITVSAKSSLIDWLAQHDPLPKITDFSVGQLLPGYVKDFQEYGCFVEVPTGLVGLCPKACLADEFVNSPRDVYSLNQSVICKITNIDSAKDRFLVSLKQADVGGEESMSGPALLQGYFRELQVFGEQAHHEIGAVVECEVQRVTGQGIAVKVGDCAGFVPQQNTTELTPGTLSKGVVLDYDPAQNSYVLSLEAEFVEQVEKSKRRKLVEGVEEDGQVVLVTETFFLVVLPSKGYRFGYVHRQHHLNDHGKTFKDIKCNAHHKVLVHRAKKGKPVILSFVMEASAEPTSTDRKRKRSGGDEVKFDDIKIGEVYTVTVRNTKQLQINVQLGRKVKGRVHITEISDTPEEGSNPISLHKHGETLQAKLIGFRHSKTYRYLPITRTNFVMSVGEFSLRKSVIDNPKTREIREDEKVDEVRDYIATLVVGQQITGFVRSIDQNGFVWICISPGVEARLWYLLTCTTKEEAENWSERFAVGQCITATVFNTRDNRIDLSLTGALSVGSKFWAIVKGSVPGVGLKLQVSARDWGIVPLTELNDHYTKDPLSKHKPDDLIQCAVVEVGEKRLVLSTRKSRISQRWKKAAGNRKVIDPVVSVATDLEVGKVYAGYVKSHSAAAGVYVALGYNLVGRTLLKNMSDNFLKNWEPMFPLGKLVKVYVLQVEPKVELSMKMSDLKKAKKEENEEGSDGEETVQRCLDDILLERYQDASDGEEPDVQQQEESDLEDVEDAPRIVFTQKKEEDGEKKSAVVGLLSDALVDEVPLVEEEEEEVQEEAEEKKGKSYLKREKKRRKEEAEEETRRLEMRSKETAPETEDDFERTVAQNPDSSSSWVCYMAYWLGSGNADKARSTAKRAIETINYRLESEKLNVWSALFNLENSFGTHESLMSACREAATVNDSKAVFTRLAAVLDKSKKYPEMDEIYQSVLFKKHKKSRKVWCNYGASLAVQQRLDDMRDTLTKALKSLPQHKHIRTISHFAQLEYRSGDANRGSTMYENVLNSYPARLDLWSVYMDKTIALGDPEQSRLLLDRAIGLKLPAKKMKFFFKRYIDFETAQGDAARLKEVKEKARHFVEALGQE